MNMVKGIVESSALLRLEFGKPGNSKKGDIGSVQTEADKSRLKLSKVLFQCDEFDAIGSFDGELRAWVTMRCLSVNVGFSGVYILPMSLLSDVEAKLNSAADERALLVEKFMGVYEAQIELARQRLKDQFSENDYPAASLVREKFRLKWRYVTFDVPENLPPELKAKQMKEREESFKVMADECRLALRETMQKLVGHLAESLKVGDDGKKKVFRDSSVTNLVDFLELFDKRDLTDDGELRELGQKARELLKDASPEKLRNDIEFRSSVRDQASAIAKIAADLVTTQKGRSFDLGALE